MDHKTYTIEEHKHNFAVWAASKSVQRGFTSIYKISVAIKKSGLKEFVESYSKCEKEQFKSFHIKCSNKIILALKDENCTYGLAAKIIAVYLKTSLILYNKGKNCENIHPPLDRILLNNFIKFNAIKEYTYQPWTKLSKSDYWDLVSLIEKYEGKINWELERYWKPFLNK
jgi:hypothetical protein